MVPPLFVTPSPFISIHFKAVPSIAQSHKSPFMLLKVHFSVNEAIVDECVVEFVTSFIFTWRSRVDWHQSAFFRRFEIKSEIIDGIEGVKTGRIRHAEVNLKILSFSYFCPYQCVLRPGLHSKFAPLPLVREHALLSIRSS